MTFSIPGELEFCFEGNFDDTPIQLVATMKAQSFLKKGCQGYMAYIVGNHNYAKLGDISIVRDYSDVFLEELHGLPPNREVDFTIELMPGTTPISKAPYQMAPLELKELKVQ